MRIYRVLAILASFVFLVGCSSIASMHGARTLKKGELKHTLSGGNLAVSADADVDTGAIGASDDSVGAIDFTVPMFEYMGRYGITDSLEVGLKTTGLVYGGDVKYKLMDTGSLALSVGLGANYISYETGATGSELKFTTIDAIIPVYLGYYMDTFSFYVVPKYLMRMFSCSATGSASCGSSDSDSTGLYGASVGLTWGKDMGLVLEYTMMMGENGLAMNQVGAGFFF